MGGIWGQTRNLDDRALGPVDLSKGRAGRPKPAGRLDMGTDTMSDIPFPSSINRGANSKKSRTATATGKTTPENQGSNLSAIRDRHDIDIWPNLPRLSVMEWTWAVGRSAEHATDAFIPRQSFGCGCAALRHPRSLAKGQLPCACDVIG